MLLWFAIFHYIWVLFLIFSVKILETQKKCKFCMLIYAKQVFKVNHWFCLVILNLEVPRQLKMNYSKFWMVLSGQKKISVCFFSHVLEMVFLFSDREHTWAKSYLSKQNWYVHVILLWPSFLIVCDHLSLYKMNIMNISFWQYFFPIMLSKQSLSNKDSSTFFPLSCFVHLWW